MNTFSQNTIQYLQRGLQKIGALKEPHLPPNIKLVNDLSIEQVEEEYNLILQKKSKLSANQRKLVELRFEYDVVGNKDAKFS